MSVLEEMLITLRQQGFDLILVWVLTMAIVYGVLTKVKMPESYSARGSISIAVGFLVMLASAGTAIPVIIMHMVTTMIVVGFALLLVVIFLELLGIKSLELMEKHANIVLVIIAVITFFSFLASGGSSVFGTAIRVPEAIVTMALFFIFAGIIIWLLAKEGGGG